MDKTLVFRDTLCACGRREDLTWDEVRQDYTCRECQRNQVLFS